MLKHTYVRLSGIVYAKGWVRVKFQVLCTLICG